MQGQFEQCRQVAVDHQRAVDRGQVQQANAVRVTTDHLLGDSQGHGGLADAAGADEGDEALAWQLHHQIVDQRPPADHARATHRQVMPARCGAVGADSCSAWSSECGATKLYPRWATVTM